VSGSAAPGAPEPELPGGAERCSCGMTHRIRTETIVVAEHAYAALAEFAGARGWRGAVAVMDANTEEAAGEAVARELETAGIPVARLRYSQRAGLRPDHEALAAAREALGARPEAGVIAVGSGVITDLTRYAAELANRGFVSVPTAASMDGYASSVAALELDELKVTLPARAPEAIFADPATIAAAPAELTRAGLGDLLGKASARTDWLAAHLLYGELYCEAVDARVLRPLREAARRAGAVLAGEREAVEGLLEGLLQSGIAMAMRGSSRPASGCEHHASHFWDLLAGRGLRPHFAHGLQVGFATRFAIRLQRYAFGGGVGALGPPRAYEPLDRAAREWLGEPSPSLCEAIETKRRFLEAGAARWPAPERWKELCAALAPALEVSLSVEAALEAAAIPAEPSFLGLDEAMLRAGFRYSNRLRPRYTTVDFLEGQGALEAALDAITSERGRAG
jgi:glycerol-1-phosphate dehydrogenase [NAD(P)+]